jgi:hypothetical protein
MTTLLEATDLSVDIGSAGPWSARTAPASPRSCRRWSGCCRRWPARTTSRAGRSTNGTATSAALVRPAQLLILDEPERRLDTAMRRTLAERLAAVVDAGGTALFASHDPAFIGTLADRIRLVGDDECSVVPPRRRRGRAARGLSEGEPSRPSGWLALGVAAAPERDLQQLHQQEGAGGRGPEAHPVTLRGGLRVALPLAEHHQQRSGVDVLDAGVDAEEVTGIGRGTGCGSSARRSARSRPTH